jgi:hypothetical protein
VGNFEFQKWRASAQASLIFSSFAGKKTNVRTVTPTACVLVYGHFCSEKGLASTSKMISRPLPGNNTAPQKQLNVRHQPLSKERLSVHKDLEKLWIGPSQNGMCVELVESFPQSLEYLDWDMTGDNSVHEEALDTLLKLSFTRHLCLRFRGDEGAVILSKHLGGASSLESLDLRGCHIGNRGALALVQALIGSSVLSLNLGYNRIGNEGIEAFAQVFNNPSSKLQGLNLSCNLFDEEGAIGLVESLSSNQSLRELSLFCNQINPTVCNALVETLGRNYTLEHVTLGATLTDIFSPIRMEIEYLLKLNRGGRDMLRKLKLPQSMWANIFASAEADVLFLFVSEKPELVRNV